MLDLTVSVSLLHPVPEFFVGFVIICGVLPTIAVIFLLTGIANDIKGAVAFLVICLLVILPMVSGKSKADGNSEDIKKYHVLEKRLLLDKVANAKVHVEQVSNHKFLVQQDKRKVLSAEIYGKRADIIPISDEGKAYLEVANYVKKQQKKNKMVANIRITPSLSSTSGSYETTKGKFRVICYADEKEQHRIGKATKVLKY
ncbi:hypothetical protein [uncultured Lactobacillus sp.]|uniref:hypothetical protein n=1 Tax=uncultured Lactobacillus sp. TaxID=153152 RepID=UPI00260211CD|nr:hypothetical protein [uncultured Lactobacillus sp.]